MSYLSQWKAGKKQVDSKNVVGTVFIDLSKTCDCILHYSLIIKLHACGFSENTPRFLYSYLKLRKQAVRISDTGSFFQMLLSGVQQRSILGLILFSIFQTNYFCLYRKWNLQTLLMAMRYMLEIKISKNY